MYADSIEKRGLLRSAAPIDIRLIQKVLGLCEQALSEGSRILDQTAVSSLHNYWLQRRPGQTSAGIMLTPFSSAALFYASNNETNTRSSAKGGQLLIFLVRLYDRLEEFRRSKDCTLSASEEALRMQLIPIVEKSESTWELPGVVYALKIPKELWLTKISLVGPFGKYPPLKALIDIPSSYIRGKIEVPCSYSLPEPNRDTLRLFTNRFDQRCLDPRFSHYLGL